MKVLFLEAFHGGSHKDFAEGFSEHSAHTVDLVTLPARFWKWRMRGAALTFHKQIEDYSRYDAIMTSSMTGVSDLKSLAGHAFPPCLVYFHENQLSYPLAPGEARDYQYGFTNITTCLAADQVAFNSKFHMNDFLARLPKLVSMMPDCRPNWVVNAIRSKCRVLYPGCRIPSRGTSDFAAHRMNPPLIVWNHRWEFDKAPEIFFDVMERLAASGGDFRIAVLGERFDRTPVIFEQARENLADRIVQYGFVCSRSEYLQWLRKGTVVVSTAIQENFGIAVVEAVRMGCLPLLPDRLAYPEIIPKQYHPDCLYGSVDELLAKLKAIVDNPGRTIQQSRELSIHMDHYCWERRITEYDRLLQLMARS